MAVTLFREFKKRQHNGSAGNLTSAGAVKVAIIDNTLAPNVQTHTEWTDLSANEVSGTNYTAGGEAVTTPTVADNADNALYSHDDVVWAQHASGFADGYYAVWYFAATGDLIGFQALTGPKGNVSGPLTLDVGAGGVVAFN